MLKLRLVPFLVLVLLAAPAVAGDFIAGAQWGDAQVDVDLPGADFELDDDGFKIFAGWKVRRFLVFELAYAELGTFEDNINGFDVTADAEILSIDLAAILPATGRLDLFAKAGVAEWDADLTISGIVANTLETEDRGLKYGLGASFKILPWLWLRAEWEKFDFDDTDNVELTTLGFQLDF